MKTTEKTTTATTTGIRQFVTIQEWLKTSPKEEEVKKVLELINRGSRKELRNDLYKKQNELRKLNRFVLEMNEMGFKPSEDVAAKVIDLLAEVSKIQEQLPTPIKKEKKEKVVKEPTVVETKIEE